jgi:hypothetical protein
MSLAELKDNERVMKVSPRMTTQNLKSAAHFTVVSTEIVPDEICKRLGIKCDSSILKGSPNPSGNPKKHPLNIAIFRSSRLLKNR